MSSGAGRLDALKVERHPLQHVLRLQVKQVHGRRGAGVIVCVLGGHHRQATLQRVRALAAAGERVVRGRVEVEAGQRVWTEYAHRHHRHHRPPAGEGRHNVHAPLLPQLGGAWGRRETPPTGTA